MNKAKVYFTDMRTVPFKKGLLDKLHDLMLAAKMDSIDFKDKFTAIKMHFGEYGNLSFLRPNFAKCVADEVKALGGKPFLTDCNTLYVGHRKNALDHLENAYLNGFSPYTTGCHIIIADGLKGTDDVAIPVPNGELVQNARIGRAVADADIIISLTHFKGHEITGFGGALKNLGMGCGSNAGKMEQHSKGKPTVTLSKCIGCRLCTKACAHNAQVFADNKCTIDHGKCVGCGQCISICPQKAIKAPEKSIAGLLDKKIAEYTGAVLYNKPNFHISIVMDVSPFCDCHPENDAPIVPNIGMFASFDPVALDQACADAVNNAPELSNSIIASREHSHDSHFTNLSPNTNWEIQLEHAEKIGLGTRQYELITV